MKYLFLIMFSFLFGASNMSAQTALNPKYTKKLNRLYKNSVPLVEAEEAGEMMTNTENIMVLDTRSEREFAVSHIEGAQFVDFDSFKKKDFAGVDKDQPVLVYCSVGYRSERIGEKLQKMGFSNVHNLYGGIFEWKNRGLNVVDNSNSATEKVHTYNEDWGQWLDKGVKVTK